MQLKSITIKTIIKGYRGCGLSEETLSAGKVKGESRRDAIFSLCMNQSGTRELSGSIGRKL